MTLTEVELLEWAQEHPAALQAIKTGLKLFAADDPLNVPLEVLDWRDANVQILAPDSSNVESEFVVQAAKLLVSVVGIDSNGHRFLARRGDYLIRSPENTYSTLKVGVTRA